MSNVRWVLQPNIPNQSVVGRISKLGYELTGLQIQGFNTLQTWQWKLPADDAYITLQEVHFWGFRVLTLPSDFPLLATLKADLSALNFDELCEKLNSPVLSEQLFALRSLRGAWFDQSGNVLQNALRRFGMYPTRFVRQMVINMVRAPSLSSELGDLIEERSRNDTELGAQWGSLARDSNA
jgi:hypothetical protein